MEKPRNNELLPCPHCGGEAHRVEGMGEYWVECMECVHAQAQDKIKVVGATVFVGSEIIK